MILLCDVRRALKNALRSVSVFSDDRDTDAHSYLHNNNIFFKHMFP